MKKLNAPVKHKAILMLAIAGISIYVSISCIRNIGASASTSGARAATGSTSPSNLDSARELALQELYSQIRGGAPCSIEEKQFLDRFINNLPLSETEADTVISRALYARYVTGQELSKKQKRLLKRYEEAVTARQGQIADVKAKLAKHQDAVSQNSTVFPTLGPNAVRTLPGFNTNTLPANDDDSTPLVNFPPGFTLNFFNQSYTGLY